MQSASTTEVKAGFVLRAKHAFEVLEHDAIKSDAKLVEEDEKESKQKEEKKEEKKVDAKSQQIIDDLRELYKLIDNYAFRQIQNGSLRARINLFCEVFSQSGVRINYLIIYQLNNLIKVCANKRAKADLQELRLILVYYIYSKLNDLDSIDQELKSIQDKEHVGILEKAARLAVTFCVGLGVGITFWGLLAVASPVWAASLPGIILLCVSGGMGVSLAIDGYKKYLSQDKNYTNNLSKFRQQIVRLKKEEAGIQKECETIYDRIMQYDNAEHILERNIKNIKCADWMVHPINIVGVDSYHIFASRYMAENNWRNNVVSNFKNDLANGKYNQKNLWSIVAFLTTACLTVGIDLIIKAFTSMSLEVGTTDILISLISGVVNGAVIGSVSIWLNRQIEIRDHLLNYYRDLISECHDQARSFVILKYELILIESQVKDYLPKSTFKVGAEVVKKIANFTPVKRFRHIAEELVGDAVDYLSPQVEQTSSPTALIPSGFFGESDTSKSPSVSPASDVSAVAVAQPLRTSTHTGAGLGLNVAQPVQQTKQRRHTLP